MEKAERVIVMDVRPKGSKPKDILVLEGTRGPAEQLHGELYFYPTPNAKDRQTVWSHNGPPNLTEVLSVLDSTLVRDKLQTITAEKMFEWFPGVDLTDALFCGQASFKMPNSTIPDVFALVREPDSPAGAVRQEIYRPVGILTLLDRFIEKLKISV
jgi:hypothetical protein